MEYIEELGKKFVYLEEKVNLLKNSFDEYRNTLQSAIQGFVAQQKSLEKELSKASKEKEKEVASQRK